MGELLGTIYGRLLMLLGIVAIAGAAIYAFSGSKVASQASDIALLQGNARHLLGSTPNGYVNFDSARTTDLVSAGVVPAGMVRNGAIVNQWGGAVTLASANNGAQGVITLAGVKNIKDCTKLLTTLADYDTLVMGKGSFTPNTRPDAVGAATACTGNDTLVITFS